jgi:hypothetical protein
MTKVRRPLRIEALSGLPPVRMAGPGQVKSFCCFSAKKEIFLSFEYSVGKVQTGQAA